VKSNPDGMVGWPGVAGSATAASSIRSKDCNVFYFD
jgi:hypothetical protein